MNKLEEYFLDMVSRGIILVILILSSGCFRLKDMHEHYINNQTLDTLYISILREGIVQDLSFDKQGTYDWNFPPMMKSGWVNGDNLNTFLGEYGQSSDTVIIYNSRNDLLIKWGGPFRDMPDSIHSIYNKNSWDRQMGGHKDEYERNTFTITNEDIGVME